MWVGGCSERLLLCFFIEMFGDWGGRLVGGELWVRWVVRRGTLGWVF